MPTDLYKALRVRKNASKAAIKKAHRRRALETHPDRGGDAEEFRAVQLAYAVLSDDEKRARYDATGETEAKPDNTTAAVVGILAQCFANVMQELIANRRRPDTENLVEHLRKAVSAQLIEPRENRRQLTEAREFMLEASERFEGEENLVSPMLRTHMGQVDQAIAKADAHVAVLEAALKVLAGLKYRHDAPPTGPEMMSWINAGHFTDFFRQ